MLYCNPAECWILDEEKCECIKDFECIQDKYYEEDPGIKPEDCICKVVDGGKWCSALTGDSIKTWKVIYAYDTIRNDTLTSGLPEGLHQYRVDHLYIRCWNIEDCFTFFPLFFTWEFDDYIQPSKIVYKSINKPRRPTYEPNEYETTIIKLKPDTLITTWYEDDFPGWIVLVPE